MQRSSFTLLGTTPLVLGLPPPAADDLRATLEATSLHRSFIHATQFFAPFGSTGHRARRLHVLVQRHLRVEPDVLDVTALESDVALSLPRPPAPSGRRRARPVTTASLSSWSIRGVLQIDDAALVADGPWGTWLLREDRIAALLSIAGTRSGIGVACPAMNGARTGLFTVTTLAPLGACH